MTLDDLKQIRLQGKRPRDTVTLIPHRLKNLAGKDDIVVKYKDEDFRCLQGLEVNILSWPTSNSHLTLIEKAYEAGAEAIFLSSIDKPDTWQVVSIGKKIMRAGDLDGTDR